MKPPKVYALYKGDEFIAVGTMEELIEMTGRNEGTLRSFGSPRAKRLKNGTLLIEVEELDEEASG